MRFTIFFAGLLGVFLSPAFANYHINIDGDNNRGGTGQQSVSVNKGHNVVNIDHDNGWNSWNSIWDYETGYAATRLFAKKACIVHRMNKEVMPSIQALDTLVKENKLQGKGPGGPPPKGLMYSINPTQVSDLNTFGKSIVGMCKGVPTYTAEESPGASLFFNSKMCLSVDVFWILNISICGEVQES
ncbi:gastrokine-1-like [Choloepus didactylus]|uniref:gastrokine-1-like n=1 Tax=Choloepus didactylus TaxID=27675 RepID=UPI00189D01C9|nr:gastrokine-1-like [Choloepus didactylus]